MMKPLQIHLIDNSHITSCDMSGGEKIVMEFARRWARENSVFLYTSNLGVNIWDRYKMDAVKKVIISKLSDPSTMLSYLSRAIVGTSKFWKMEFDQDCENILYSASDFWPDVIPAFVAKLRNHHLKWVAGFYMFAPKPWQKNSPYKGRRWLLGALYWFTQFPVYYLIKKYADMVFVTSAPDVKKFVTSKRNPDKIIVIRGGVDVKSSSEYLRSAKVIALDKRKYDALFVGRFHYQKGVRELVDIWKIVCAKKPTAKLAMIGNGPLEAEVRKKINLLGLGNNVDLLGFKDGQDKYEIFKESKIVLHPAVYDSGGMAPCEAMAWGLPAVSFDLEALKTYYPKGMLKTPCYDFKIFAEQIIKLLEEDKLYEKTREDAIAWAEEWDWDKRAQEMFQKMKTLFWKVRNG